MQLTLFRRWIAALAVSALLCGSTAYLSHSEGQQAPHKAGHCDLCSHFSSTSGPSAAPHVVGKPVLAVRRLIEPTSVVRAVRRNVDSRLPRGPPAFELT